MTPRRVRIRTRQTWRQHSSAIAAHTRPSQQSASQALTSSQQQRSTDTGPGWPRLTVAFSTWILQTTTRIAKRKANRNPPVIPATFHPLAMAEATEEAAVAKSPESKAMRGQAIGLPVAGTAADNGVIEGANASSGTGVGIVGTVAAAGEVAAVVAVVAAEESGAATSE